MKEGVPLKTIQIREFESFIVGAKSGERIDENAVKLFQHYDIQVVDVLK